ncbi:hypothetical protein ADMFC3_18130 [Geovibrio sp. ADMFC3]
MRAVFVLFLIFCSLTATAAEKDVFGQFYSQASAVIGEELSAFFGSNPVDCGSKASVKGFLALSKVIYGYEEGRIYTGALKENFLKCPEVFMAELASSQDDVQGCVFFRLTDTEADEGEFDESLAAFLKEEAYAPLADVYDASPLCAFDEKVTGKFDFSFLFDNFARLSPSETETAYSKYYPEVFLCKNRAQVKSFLRLSRLPLEEDALDRYYSALALTLIRSPECFLTELAASPDAVRSCAVSYLKSTPFNNQAEIGLTLGMFESNPKFSGILNLYFNLEAECEVFEGK